MKRAARQSRFLKYFASSICLLMALLLTMQNAFACSWDYPIWIIRSRTADPLYRFIQNDKAGYIDRSGKVVVKPQFDFYGNGGGEFESGLLHLSVSAARYADTTGKLVIEKNYSSAWDFSEGLAAALPEDGKKWGYIDRSGEFVISPRFEGYPNGYVYSFSDGMARIEAGKRYGYIDRSGEFVIQPKLFFGTDFRNGMARVFVEGPCSYFFMHEPCSEARSFGEADAGPPKACKFAFIDKSGSVISKERYDDAKDFSEGLAPVMLEDKWGYIDKKGQMVIRPSFDEAEPFSDGLASVKIGERYGFIDHSGAFLIPPQFEVADNFSDGLAVVGRRGDTDGDFYYINKSGRSAFPERFALASQFFKGLAHVKLKPARKKSDDSATEVTFAYINTTGKKVFTYSYKLDD